MMADNVEHVISYWLLFDKFKSPLLGGFAVVSHWLPFLFFSLYSGSLADRYDPRRLMQIGMALFMFVSLAWAVLFYTDALQVWHAVVLLTLHGFAGVFWNPPAQVLLYDIVGADKLHSAVRLSATGRWLGLLLGPGIGAGILLLFGPKLGIALNALIYLPMMLWLYVRPMVRSSAKKSSCRHGRSATLPMCAAYWPKFRAIARLSRCRYWPVVLRCLSVTPITRRCRALRWIWAMAAPT